MRESLSKAGAYLQYVDFELTDQFYRLDRRIVQQAERVKQYGFRVDQLLSILVGDTHLENAMGADIMDGTSAIAMCRGVSAVVDRASNSNLGLYLRKTKQSPKELIGIEYIVAKDEVAGMEVQWSLDEVPVIQGLSLSFFNPDLQTDERIVCVPVPLNSQREDVVRQFTHFELVRSTIGDAVIVPGRVPGVRVIQERTHKQKMFYAVNLDTSAEDNLLLYVAKY